MEYVGWPPERRGTLWLSRKVSGAAHAFFHATPLTLIMPDGSSEQIRVTEGHIHPGTYSPMAFVLERHVRANADENDEDLAGAG